MTQRTVHKKNILKSIEDDSSSLKKYQDFFIGSSHLLTLLKYEFSHFVASPMPGALGYILRKFFLKSLLGGAGPGLNLGRNVSFRHPGKIIIGESTAIDDNCLLDAHGVGFNKFTIGAHVMIARGTALSAKTDHGFIEIGNHCNIGKHCVLSSTGGIKMGEYVGIADTCYIGGGRYRTDRSDIPMIKQDLYTEGPVEIGDNCWIGTGVRVLDGVSIGSGSIIGAGAVVRENVPENTVVTAYQRLVMLPRDVHEDDENF